MSCKKYQRLILGLIYEDISDRQKKKLQYHLNSCRTCRNELESLRNVLNKTRIIGPENDLPEYVDTRILSHAKAELEKNPQSKHWIFFKPLPATLALVALVAALTVLFRTHYYSRPVIVSDSIQTTDKNVLGESAPVPSGFSDSIMDSDREMAEKPSMEGLALKEPEEISSESKDSLMFFSQSKEQEDVHPAPEIAEKNEGRKKDNIPSSYDKRTDTKPTSRQIPFDAAKHKGTYDEMDNEGALQTSGRSEHEKKVDIKHPRVISKDDPEYPKDFISSGIEGSVKIRLSITASGEINTAAVIVSLHPVFDDIALETVRKWQFQPALKNGKPVDDTLDVDVNFKKPGN
ncbi:energy transducer TonB [bacterium]|nr:energy transducer TonB [candidate division CSSED10-310 bacterium]